MRKVLILTSLAAALAFGHVPVARAEGDAATAPAVSDADKAKWGDHMGDLPFVIGAPSGVAAAAASGHTPMYFFTATW
jgi:hypothetical protein